jgi:hypothetical protein
MLYAPTARSRNKTPRGLGPTCASAKLGTARINPLSQYSLSYVFI